MTDSEGEIEYLDEDAEIVQQCVQTGPVQTQTIPKGKKYSPVPRPLLVERVQRKREAKEQKRVQKNEESDYDPLEDLRLSKRRKTQANSKVMMKPLKPLPLPLKLSKPDLVTQSKEAMLGRRKMDIRLPDYEDPLCLPVKLIRRDADDLKKLRNWNNLCLDHLKDSDENLKPKVGASVSSKRIVVLRNVKHNVTGNIDMTVWSKTTVENSEGDKKSEVFQCILPKYREKCLLEYNLLAVKKKKLTRSVNTVILTKEDNKDGESLVIYSPLEATSSVYKLIDEPEPDPEKEEDEKPDNPATKRYLQETACCKICAPCYQSSWRPTRTKGDDSNISCVICKRSFMSVYNLLTHVRTHATADVRRHQRAISQALSKVVDYHYKCRICQEEFFGIKDLRKHITTHLSKEKFFCEVGNHFTQ